MPYTEPESEPDEIILPTIERRPPAKVTPAEANAWGAIRSMLASKLSSDVCATWFAPVYFDGIEKEEGCTGTLKLRCGAVTHDWINRYYTETLDGAAASVLGGDVSVKWEIEEDG